LHRAIVQGVVRCSLGFLVAGFRGVEDDECEMGEGGWVGEVLSEFLNFVVCVLVGGCLGFLLRR